MTKLSDLIETYVDARLAAHRQEAFRFPDPNVMRHLTDGLETARRAIDDWAENNLRELQR